MARNRNRNAGNDTTNTENNANPAVNREQELLDRIAALEAQLAAAPRGAGSARRSEVIAVLRKGPASIKAMAMSMNTTTRNVSSVLTGLRKAGYVIHTDEQSRKYLVSEPDPNAVPPANDADEPLVQPTNDMEE